MFFACVIAQDCGMQSQLVREEEEATSMMEKILQIVGKLTG